MISQSNSYKQTPQQIQPRTRVAIVVQLEAFMPGLFSHQLAFDVSFPSTSNGRDDFCNRNSPGKIPCQVCNVDRQIRPKLELGAMMKDAVSAYSEKFSCLSRLLLYLSVSK